MADIFVSYSRKDRDEVARIVEGLQKQGWSVWWDPNILPGERFSQSIDAELKSAKCILVVWSEDSAHSDWVQEEAEDGKARGVLLPVLVDDIPIPRGFRRVQTVDLGDWQGQKSHAGWNYVLAAAKRFVEGGPAPAMPPPKTRRQKRLAFYTNIASVVLLAIIASGVWWGATHPAQVTQITQTIVNIFTGGQSGGVNAGAGGQNGGQASASGDGEPNNSYEQSTAFPLGQTVEAQAPDYDQDYYRFTASESYRNIVRYRLETDAPMAPSLLVVNAERERMANDSTGAPGATIELETAARPGETMFAVVAPYSLTQAGVYRLTIVNDTTHRAAARTPNAQTEVEPNNDAFTPQDAEWGRPLLGFFAVGDEDVYRVSAPATPGATTIWVRSAMPTICPGIIILDANKNTVTADYTRSAGGDISVSFEPASGATYYVRVYTWGGCPPGYGDYVIEFARP